MAFTFSDINIGTTPNDGTGDSLRVAFGKIDRNFNTISNIGNAEITCLTITSTYDSRFNHIAVETLDANTFINFSTINNTSSNINGVSNTYTFDLSGTGSGQHTAYKISPVANVTASLSSSIVSGLERKYWIKNPGPNTANIILPITGNNTNKGTNVFSISANTTATICFTTFGTTAGNVFAEIINN